jgi:hypothetical protein
MAAPDDAELTRRARAAHGSVAVAPRDVRRCTGVILACLRAFWRYDARTAGAPEDAGREQFA